LDCVAVCCSVLQCVAVCCSVLQCVAVCCSVLQCVTVCCHVIKKLPAKVIHVTHTWMCHVTHTWMSHQKSQTVPMRENRFCLAHNWTSHVTHMYESYHTDMNQACHTYSSSCVMSHTHEWFTGELDSANEDEEIMCERVTSHVCMSHVIHPLWTSHWWDGKCQWGRRDYVCCTHERVMMT